VNEGCVVMVIPHPSHSFTEPHPTVGLRNCSGNPGEKNFRWMNEISLCKTKGLIVHPIVQEHMCGNLEVPIGFPKFAMEFPRGREAISWDNI
jgi:hypothetical protein